MQLNYNPVDRNSKAYLQKLRADGRYALLIVLGFTAANLLVLLWNPRQFFLFSASVPYYLTLLGKLLDNPYTELWPITGFYTLSALGISAVILGVYGACYFLSSHRDWPLTAALVLFLADTLATLICSQAFFGSLFANIMDIFIHGWVLWQLFAAIRASKRIRRFPPEEQESSDK